MFKLHFKTSNAAFDDDLKWMEAGNILRETAEYVSDGRTSGTIFDGNGNSIGTWEWAMPLGDIA